MSLQKNEAVFAASRLRYAAESGDVQVPWRVIHE